MAKTKQKQNLYLRFINQPPYIILLYIIIAPFIGLVLYGFCMVILFSGILSISGKEAQKHNPAEPLAKIMIPFAEKNKLENIYEYNNPPSIGNSIPEYIYVYQGNQSANEMQMLIKDYLQQNGYNMQYVLYTYDPECYFESCASSLFSGEAINENKPYWVFRGTNTMGDGIYGEITDKTYFTNKENPISDGKIVLKVSFRSHECDECTTLPTSIP